MSVRLTDREIVLVSNIFEDIYGYPPQKFRDDPEFFKKVVHPDDLDIALEARQTCLRDGFVEFQHRVILPDGQIKWINRRAWVTYDESGQPIQVNDSGQDITERKQAEDGLRFYGEVLNNIAEGVHIVSVENEIFVYTNPTFNQMFGYEDGELIGKHPSVLNAPNGKDPIEVAGNIVSSLKSTGKWQGEVFNVRKDGTTFWTRANIVEFEHREYGTVWITVQDNITEEKRQQQALIESESRLNSLIDSQTNYVIRTNLEGRYTYWNKKFEQEYGWLHAENGFETGYGLDTICEHHHDRTRKTVEKCIQNPGDVVMVELDKPLQDGSISSTLWEFVCLTDGEGNPSEIQCMGIDVTERMQAEKNLRVSEERYRQMFELVNIPKLITDPKTARILDANPAAVDFYGYSLPTLKSMTMLQINIAEPDFVLKKMKQVADGEIKSCLFEQRLADGTVRDVEGYAVGIEHQGQHALYCTYIDTTERNHAQAALELVNMELEERVQERTKELEQSRNRLEAIFHHSADGILLLNTKQRIVQSNYAFDQMFALQRNDSSDQLLAEFIIKEDQAKFHTIMREVIELHQSRRIETQTKSIAGIGFDIEISIAPINRTYQSVENIVCIIRDVTERKESEKALKNSERLLRQLADNYPAYVSFIENDYTVGFTAGLEFKKLGLDSAQFTGLTLDQVFGEHADVVRSHYEKVFAGEDQSFDLQSGEQYQHYRAVPLQDDEGEIKQILAVVENITERKKAELKIAEERNLLRTIIDAVPDYIYVKAPDGRMLLNNMAQTRALGYDHPREVVGKTDFELFPQDMAEKFLIDEQKLYATEAAVIRTEERSVGKDGEEIWVLTTKVPLRDLDGKIVGLVGITHDVTEIKSKEQALVHSEQQLRESQNMLQIVLDTIPVRVFWKDLESCYLGANKLFMQDADLEGASMREIIGRDDFELFPHQAERYRKDDKEVIESGEARINDEEPQTTPSGETIWLQTSKIPLRNALGETIGMLGTYTDITDRKTAEAQLRFLARLQDQITNSVIATDLHLNIKSWNKAAERIYGWKAEETIGKPLPSILKLDFQGGATLDTVRQSIMEHGVWQGEIIQAHRDGTRIYAESSVVANVDEAGKVIGFIGVDHDVTERKKAEEQLRFLARLQEQMHDAVIATDLDFIVQSWNKAAEELYGWKAEEIVGKKLTDYLAILFEDGETIESTFQDLLDRGWWSDEVIQYHRDGQSIHVDASIVVNKDEAGKVVGIIGVNHDITERKEAEIALKESKERYRLLAENVTDMISRHDPAGNYTYTTPSSIELTGYSPDELLGRLAYEFFHPEDIAAIQESHKTIIEVPLVSTIAYRFLKKDGTYTWLETTSHTIKDVERDEIVEIIAVSRDITERKTSEAQLTELSQRLQLATEAGQIGIWDWDLNSNSSVWDTQLYKMFGKSTDDPTPPIEIWQNSMHPDDWVETEANNYQSIDNEDKTFQTEFRIIVNGEVRYIKSNALIIRDSRGKAQRVVGTNIDVTENKLAEEALRSSLAKERQLSDMKSRFVSMASHEFRTPLAAIMATTETLKIYRDRMSGEKIDTRLDKILSQVDHMKQLMDDVLHLARVQAGKLDYNPLQKDISLLCQDIVEEFDGQKAYHGRVIYHCDSDKTTFEFDEKLIRQVVSNLISNALKYSSSEDSVDLTLTRSGGVFEIVVEDHGIGIPEQDLEHLFEAFHRATNVGTISGTGLGLNIALRSVEAHGGTIEVDSEVDVGTTFRVKIPINEEEGDQDG